MGMKKWLQKKQEELKNKKDKKNDPEAQKAAKKEQAKKLGDATVKILKLAKKGAEAYKDVNKKVEEVKDNVNEKLADLTKKAEPIAEKIDDTASKIGGAAKDLFNKAVKKVVPKGTIIDLIAPAKPKKEDDGKKPGDDQPKP